MVKKIILIFLSALLIFLVSCTKASSPGEPSTPPTPDVNGYYTVSAAGVTFKWKVNGANLDCKLSAATTGWVGVGFGTTGNMIDAKDFVMGYVTGGTTATISDRHADGYNPPPVDTVQHISNPAGTEASGTTEITYTIPLNSLDAQDMALTQNMSLWILLARGSNGADNFTTQHVSGGFGAVQTTLY